MGGMNSYYNWNRSVLKRAGFKYDESHLPPNPKWLSWTAVLISVAAVAAGLFSDELVALISGR
jgi:hypothetical protein